MQTIKLKPMGLAFNDSSDSTVTRLSDIGNYRVRISPIKTQNGLRVYGDITFGKSVTTRGDVYARAMLHLSVEPNGYGPGCRYTECDDKDYHYTMNGIRELLSDIAGEPCDIKMVEEES